MRSYSLSSRKSFSNNFFCTFLPSKSLGEFPQFTNSHFPALSTSICVALRNICVPVLIIFATRDIVHLVFFSTGKNSVIVSVNGIVLGVMSREICRLSSNIYNNYISVVYCSSVSNILGHIWIIDPKLISSVGKGSQYSSALVMNGDQQTNAISKSQAHPH